MVTEVRSRGRNSHNISDHLVSLSQAKVGNEARLVITFLLVITVVMVAVVTQAVAGWGDVASDDISLMGGCSACWWEG